MRSGHGLAAILAGAVFFVWLGLMAVSWRAAALPPQASGTVLAVFPPRHTEAAIFAAIVRAGGRPVRATWLDFAWIAHGDEPGFVAGLRAEGAVGAFDDVPLGPSLGGCAAVVTLGRFMRQAGLME
jgi:hypothetical protein